MSSKLTQNIKHNCEYNAGGVAGIFLLDIRSFIAYRFKNDLLFNQCFVEAIKVSEYNYIAVDTIEGTKFTETADNGIYQQQLTTFVRSLDAEKTANLLIANANNYIVLYRTFEGKYFCFGSDGGAKISFSQLSGASGESSGYSLTIDKSSIYPLFEIDFHNTEVETLLSTENDNLVITEDNFFIPILQIWKQ
jgi:hypothetical protein|nr:MAG TPA: hypothetical protein [Caudoviricetes sp.]